MELSAILTPASEGGYVVLNPETGTTTQGETVEEALNNLRESTELYLEEFPFQHLLASCKISLHYDVEDFEQDLETLKRLEQ